MRKKVMFLLLFIICLACSNENSKKDAREIVRIINEKDFQRVDSVEHKLPKGIEDYLIDPRFIDISGSLLLIVDNNDRNIFQFFDLSKLTRVSAFGSKGEGPGEVSTPVFINHKSFFNDDEFEYLDWGRKVLNSYSVKQIENEEAPIAIKEYMLSSRAIRVQRAVFLDDEYVVGLGALREGKIIKVSTRTDSVLKVTPFTPYQKEALDFATVGYIYTGEIAVNKSRKEIVVVTPRFKIIEIYDYDLNLVRDFRFEEEPKTKLGVKGSSSTEETVRHYNDVTFTDQFIYALYLGNTVGSYKTGVGLNNSEIHVFDWDGNPVKKIVVDTDLSRIALDREGNRIFGISAYNNFKKYSIMYFDIPFDL